MSNLKLIKRAVRGGYIKADMTGQGDWEAGQIVDFDDHNIFFQTISNPEETLNIRREFAYKATREEYESGMAEEAVEAPKSKKPAKPPMKGQTVDHSKLEPADDKEADLDEDDLEGPSSVVPTKYRDIYRERGNPNHCGDWLAQLLEGNLHKTETVTLSSGKKRKTEVFDFESFTKLLRNNGVDMTGKWVDLPNTQQRGWQGRYRMNGRQKLEKVIAANGYIKLNGHKVKLPSDYLEHLRAKHPSVLEA